MSTSGLVTRARELTRQAREEMAAKLLEPETVARAVREAAARGADFVVLEPPAPTRFREAEKAKAAVERLARQGFRVTWVECRSKPSEAAGDGLELGW